MYGYTKREKNLAQQVALIKKRYENFTLTFNHIGLKAIGEIQPTARSEKYTIEIKYHLKQAPRIRVLKPTLVVNFNGDKIPHVYPGNILCLFQPKYREFTYSDYISDTIIPWTSLWLYHYEGWHITGKWEGGGEHPVIKNKKKKR